MRADAVVGVLCLFIGTVHLTAPAASAADNLDGLLEPIRQEFKAPALVAAVAKNGEIVAAGAVGLRALGFDAPVTPEDRIHIGSDGKAMTALLAGMLVDEGKLSWDSTIGEVLGDKVPDINPKLAAITIDQLLSHSSGIPTDTEDMLDIYFNVDAFDYNSPTLRLMALDAWKHHEPAIPEISPFQYANFGYMTAGAMIEEASGKAWEQLIRERIYQPLRLTSAGIGPTATPGLVDAAIGHATLPDGTLEPRMWGNAADMPQLLAPAGTAHMSILDFARWGSWVAGKTTRGPKLVEPKTLNHLLAEKVRTPARPNPAPGTPAEGGYASGWSIEKFDWTDKEVLTHNGSNGLNLAKILIDIDRDLVITVATNFGGRDADLAAGKALAQLYKEYR